MCSMALATMASGVGCPYAFRIRLESEPVLTPMRMGTFLSPAAFTTAFTLSALPMLPGLMRSPSTPCLSASRASR